MFLLYLLQLFLIPFKIILLLLFLSLIEKLLLLVQLLLQPIDSDFHIIIFIFSNLLILNHLLFQIIYILPILFSLFHFLFHYLDHRIHLHTFLLILASFLFVPLVLFHQQLYFTVLFMQLFETACPFKIVLWVWPFIIDSRSPTVRCFRLWYTSLLFQFLRDVEVGLMSRTVQFLWLTDISDPFILLFF